MTIFGQGSMRAGLRRAMGGVRMALLLALLTGLAADPANAVLPNGVDDETAETRIAIVPDGPYIYARVPQAVG